MEQIRRIQQMESILNGAAAAVEALSRALENYEAILPELRQLEAYYESPVWLRDLEDDSAGRLPQELRRGVLSEDGIDTLLCARDELLERLRSLAEEGGHA